ncbi:hypothetical protein C4577_07565 [Candidatus Parcubacteria bacterium]|nr:MAG: hypothetical protein C4577_07565 [Candidatus Parcubacteria bacterium]
MLSFDNAPGNLFNRLGKCGVPISQMAINQAAQLQNLTNTTTGVVAQFDSESDIQAIVGQQYISQLNSDTIGSLMSQVAVQTINRMVYRDNPQFALNLSYTNTIICINEVIRQMKIEGATILQQTVSATPIVVSNPGPNFTGIGNGVIVTSVTRPGDGLILQNIFAENIQLVCSSDSYIGGATAGNETITITGTGNVGVFNFNWPQGSNASNTISAIDGDSNNSSNNLLTNSGFTSFTGSNANAPDKWTIVVGAAGTDIFKETTIVYGTGNALRILGDGSTLVQIKQQFDNSSTGTPGELDPLTQYSVCLFMRRDGVAGTGIMVVDLIDGGNNVINDAGGNPNSFTIDLADLNTVYQPFTGSFRTPLALPSQQWLRIRLTTAYANGRSFYIDKIGFGEMTQLAVNEPFFSVHSGSINFTQGDYGNVTASNSRGAGGTLNTFQTLLNRLISEVYSNEFIFPYSPSPSISDSLIG